MHTRSLRPILASVAMGVLAGCAHQPPTHVTAASTTTTASPSGATATATTTRPTTTTSATVHHATAATRRAHAEKLPSDTGIAACDDYLSSYMACHRAANIFPADQLQSRYDLMRTTLLRDSMDPDARPQLAARCESLARDLRESLHGKSCSPNPAPASSPGASGSTP